jgi:hypothetical protein
MKTGLTEVPQPLFVIHPSKEQLEETFGSVFLLSSVDIIDWYCLCYLKEHVTIFAHSRSTQVLSDRVASFRWVASTGRMKFPTFRLSWTCQNLIAIKSIDSLRFDLNYGQVKNSLMLTNSFGMQLNKPSRNIPFSTVYGFQRKIEQHKPRWNKRQSPDSRLCLAELTK